MSETKKRKVFSAEFKAKVGLEAVRGVKTLNEIAQDYGVHFRETDCRECSMKARCLRNTNTVSRQVTFFTGRTQEIKREVNATSRMIEKIDGGRGREIYSHRMGIVEPVFGNIRSAKRLSRFSVRGGRIFL